MSLFIARETPWAGLGTVVKEAVGSAEALKLAGLDWRVKQLPVIHNNVDSGYKMNIRTTDEKVLGVVGGRYKPVQNDESAKFMDDLIGKGIKYESAGCFQDGKRMWLLASLPEVVILDDVTIPYMCLTNSHDGFGSLKVFMTPVRVACQNMLNLALSRSKRWWPIRHTGNIESKLHEAQRTFGLATGYIDSLKLEAETLSAIKVSPKDYMKLSEALFPITADMSTRKEESQLILRSQLDTAWNMEDLNNIRGTGWGYMNAVADMATHKAPARATENSRENAFMYSIDSPVILDEAYKQLKAFAKAS